MRAVVPSNALIVTLVGVLCLIWGSTWVVIKEGLQDLPPLTSAAVRFTIAATVMFVLAPILAKKEGGDRPPTWLWISSGLMNFAISYGIVYVSETVLPSGLVSVLWAIYPLMMAFAGHWFLPGERLSLAQVVGFVIGFGGIVFLFSTDVRAIGEAAPGMAAFLLLSPFVSTIGTVLVKRYGAKSSSVLLNRNGMTVGAIGLAAAAFVFEPNETSVWSNRAMLSVGYLSIVGTVVTFSLYFWLLRFARANRMALIAFVTPCVALFLGWAIGGEAIATTTIIGAGLVVLGVALVVVRRA